MKSLIAILLLVSPLIAEDWPQWRGPRHDGTTGEASGWPKGWPPRTLWEMKVGYGCSSPVIIAGKMYVTGWLGRPSSRAVVRGTDQLLCLEAATGRVLWKQTYASPYQARKRTGDTGAYGGPSSTPSVDKKTGYLYTMGIDGDLICWDTAKAGRPVWRVNLYDRFDVPQRPHVGGGRRDYGFPGAPLIWGDQIIVEVGGRKGTVAAFDKKTGRRLWQSEYNKPAGHSGGLVPCTVSGHKCLALLTLSDLIVLRMDSSPPGRTVATTPWRTEFACNIPTPAAAGEAFVVSSDYNHKKTALLGLAGGSFRTRWSSRAYATTSSPVVHGRRVYVIGSALQCLDLATGRLIWRGGNFRNGSCLVTSDDKIIAFGNGRVSLVDASPQATEYKELSRAGRLVRGTCYPHVALSDGLIAVKDRYGHLVCLSVRGGSAGAAVATKPPQDPGPTKLPSGPTRPGPRPSADPRDPHEAKPPALSSTWPACTDAMHFQYPPAGKAAGMTTRGKARIGSGGSTTFEQGAVLVDGVAERLRKACQASGQLAIEVVFAPADVRQGGPARIAGVSLDGYHRNVTLCQERDTLILRLRTTRTGENGMRPQTTIGRVRAGRTHHVIVSYAPGHLRCYLDGREVVRSRAVTGDLSNWAKGYQFLLGDEWKEHRYWRGRIDKVAVHSRVVTPAEAKRRWALAMKGVEGRGSGVE